MRVLKRHLIHKDGAQVKEANMVNEALRTCVLYTLFSLLVQVQKDFSTSFLSALFFGENI